MTFRRWDVVAVPFPFVEGTEAKRRPGLIVSTDLLRERHGVYWITMITTAKAGRRDGDIAIDDGVVPGLPDACVIRPSVLATLSDAQINRRLGSIPAGLRTAVHASLKRYIA